MNVTELSIKRPILIIVIFMALTLLGLFGYNQLKYELFPSINVPVVSISTDYKGASASVVESAVTEKVENAVSGLDKIDTVTSNSTEGNSRVSIQFTQDANIDVALQEAQRKVLSILKRLPSGVSTPTLNKVSMDERPIMTIGFTSNLDETQFYQLMDDSISQALSQVAGVGQVSISGGRQREIQVNLDPQKLQSYGLSPVAVLAAIKNGNVEYPIGTVNDSDYNFSVRLVGKFKSLDDLRTFVVGTVGGQLVYLSDLAEVQDGAKDVDTISRINGLNTIGLVIRKQSDANAVEVSQLVNKTLRKLEHQYRKYDLHAQIASDTSTFIVNSANGVKEDLLWAILLVAGVMLLFLHSIRNSVIVMVAIPTSLVTTFIGMWACDFTLNVITLLALSLVIGILVDDAIVVLENIYRHLEKGEDSRIAALLGRNEIGFTALSITLVDVVVYLPLALVTGQIGGMIKQFALVIVIATLTSLFVSFTVTPMLASRFSKLNLLNDRTWLGRFGQGFEKFYGRLTVNYLQLLRTALHHPGKVLLTAGVIFCLALALVPCGFIGSEYMPQADQAEVAIDIQLPTGSKVEQTNSRLEMVERLVSQMPGVEKLFAAAGDASSGTGGTNKGYVNVKLVPKEERSFTTDEFGKRIRKQLRQTGMKISVSQPNIMMGGGGSTPVQVAVMGPSWDGVMASAQKVMKLVAKIPGTSDVKLSSDDGNPEMSIMINRAKMANLGVDADTAGQALQLGLTGNTDSKYTDNGTDYDIDVRLDKAYRVRTDDIANMVVPNKAGQLIPVNQFAAVVPSTGPTVIQRRSRSFSISVTSQALGRSSGAIGADITAALEKEKFPNGVNIAFVGNLKNQKDSFGNLGVALLAAVIFVYLIMAALYNSFIYPLSVLFAVPLAVIGALLALALTGKTLAVFSIMGMIMLVGLVSKNAILLVDFTNRAREEEGLGVEEALIAAGKERLRPILMTTMTMILGMLPLATSATTGSEFKNGLGWVLIGGLSCSMLMTLVVVPVVYTRVEWIRNFCLHFGTARFTRKNKQA
jgi:HAE1 family hydrophobic/amphiphilic exporter-1